MYNSKAFIVIIQLKSPDPDDKIHKGWYKNRAKFSNDSALMKEM